MREVAGIPTKKAREETMKLLRLALLVAVTTLALLGSGCATQCQVTVTCGFCPHRIIYEDSNNVLKVETIRALFVVYCHDYH